MIRDDVKPAAAALSDAVQAGAYFDDAVVALLDLVAERVRHAAELIEGGEAREALLALAEELEK